MVKNIYRLYFGIVCILSFAIAILCGFVTSTIYDLGTNGYQTFRTAALSVLKNPFSCYFNSYTFIFCFIFFLMFEAVIFIIYFISSRDKGTEAIDMEEFYEPYDDNEDIKANNTDNFDLDGMSDNIYASMIDAADIENIQADTNENESRSDDTADLGTDEKIEDNQEKKTDRVIAFSEDIIDDLTNAGFDVIQVNSMLKIKYYVDDIKSEVLCSIFKTSMSPDEIENTIELFYE